ncbi:hypothetical protein SAMN04488571_103171 [Methanoculleus thermophilus]|uniref:Uncharacterized protein n=1 Tax=Methanoculleus thermophilus TaxID=2200 RepID=A0A1G8YRS8_9EURY|nr:hypothetical protein SAMN04488571_103171 [Methanoculleus thermophilus]
MAEPGPDNYDKELGSTLGLLLVIIWIVLLVLSRDHPLPAPESLPGRPHAGAKQGDPVR